MEQETKLYFTDLTHELLEKLEYETAVTWIGKYKPLDTWVKPYRNILIYSKEHGLNQADSLRVCFEKDKFAKALKTEELFEIIKKDYPKKTFPQLNSIYYYITFKDVGERKFVGSWIDIKRKVMCNMFETKEQAEGALKILTDVLREYNENL